MLEEILESRVLLIKHIASDEVLVKRIVTLKVGLDVHLPLRGQKRASKHADNLWTELEKLIPRLQSLESL